MDERKLEKRQKSESDKNYLLDRISVLPYEILVSIVSLLSVKEAGSTSTLSRRWKNVWKYTMTLNFQDIDFSVGDSFRSFKAQDQEHQEQRSCNYVNWVDRVLEQHRGQNFKRFRAFFFINSSFTSSIDKWIEFALEKRVEVLQLQFLASEDGYTEDNYTFLPRLVDLSSSIPSLHSCRFSVGFKYLKHLLFQHVGVTGEVLEYFLSNCPVLERLEVFIAKNLVSLRVIGISTSLKYLEIKNCPDIRSIEISNANIVSFVYEGHWIYPLLSNVPLLVEVDIFKPDLDIYNFTTLVFNRLSCCLSQLEILKLSIWGVIPYLLSCPIPALENLKHLELSVQADDMWDIDLITSFMKACPYIQKLVINMGFVKYDEYYDMKVAESPHYSIKVVEIVGYRGCSCALQHVVYVMKNAVALEKLIIDPVRRPQSGMDRGAQSVEEEAYAREHVKKHLKDRVPSNIEFVCL